MTKWCRALTISHGLPAFLALMLGAFGIMAIDRNSPVEVVWGKVIPPEVYAGQSVTFHYGSIKHTDYFGTIKRWVVDANGSVYYLSDTTTVGETLDFNKEQEVVKAFVVPCGIAVGSATYHADAALATWWNIVQWHFPIHRELNYPFIVKAGAKSNVCALHGTQGVQGEQGEQGLQGIQGEPGKNLR